jgi:hypothetical protein
MVENVPSHLLKAWYYANNFLYTSIKDSKHLEVFLSEPEVVKKWTEEEISYLKKYWILIKEGKIDFVILEEPLLNEDIEFSEIKDTFKVKENFTSEIIEEND